MAEEGAVVVVEGAVAVERGDRVDREVSEGERAAGIEVEVEVEAKVGAGVGAG
jgi:hypothetical protein